MGHELLVASSSLCCSSNESVVATNMELVSAPGGLAFRGSTHLVKPPKVNQTEQTPRGREPHKGPSARGDLILISVLEDLRTVKVSKDLELQTSHPARFLKTIDDGLQKVEWEQVCCSSEIR